MKVSSSNRSGVFRRQPAGHTAFVPAPFPPDDLDLASLQKTYRVFGFDRYLQLFQERDNRG